MLKYINLSSKITRQFAKCFSSELLQKQSGGESIVDLIEFAKCGNFHLASLYVMILLINFIPNNHVMIFTITFCISIFNFTVFLKMTL